MDNSGYSQQQREEWGCDRMTRKTKSVVSHSIVRSSAAEYLTFVAARGSLETSVEMRYEDENIWLTQKMMATLYV